MNSYSFFEYDHKERWSCYYEQIKNVLSLNPKRVLEVGVGNKFVYNYLRRNVAITSLDIDKERRPDRVGTVLHLSKIWPRRRFDVVLCCQVLEHLEFDEFSVALEELRKVTAGHVILSLPHRAMHITFQIKFNRSKKGFYISIPRYCVPVKNKSVHKWEIGWPGYSKSRLRSKISEKFDIVKEYGLLEDPYYRFYILKPK